MTYASITKDAQKGDPKARYELAQMYHRGLGVPRDLKQAARWYRMAAEQGYVKAQVQLAGMHYRGEGLALQYDKALHWYEKAAEQGDKESQRNLAAMYADGLGVEADFEKALVWYQLSGHDEPTDILKKFKQKAAEAQGGGRLQFQLAKLLDNGRLPGDGSETLEWYQRAADNGHLEAMLSLAMRLGMRQSDEECKRRAREYLMKARERGSTDAEWELALQKFEEQPCAETLARVIEGAQQGHTRSQYVAAKAWLKSDLGSGTIDREWVMQALRSAAEKGYVDAQFMFGEALMQGTFAEQGEGLSWIYQAARADSVAAQYCLSQCHFVVPEERQQWLETAARNNLPEAQLALAGQMHAYGDISGAISLVWKAAESGLVQAQFRLARLLAEREQPDWTQVREWLCKASDAGHGDAAFTLYDMYMKGQGVEPNEKEATFWLMRAAKAGLPEAQFRLATASPKILREIHGGADVSARELLEAAASTGHGRAQYVLALAILDEILASESAARTPVEKLGAQEQNNPYVPQHAPDRVVNLLNDAACAGVLQAAELLADYYICRGASDAAVPYLQMCTNAGNAICAFTLAGVLSDRLKNDYDPITEQQIVHSLKVASDAGNSEASFQLAVLTARGEGITEDYDQAFRLFKRAAEDGVKEAQFRIGVMLLSGLGCDPDPSEAESWLRQAAESKHVEAAFALAQLYDSSEDDEKKHRVRELYSLAANAGHVGATAKLASMTMHMDNIPAELSSWASSLVVLASCGNELADQCLKQLFSAGPDSYANIEIALFWYRQGAGIKNSDAQFWLADCYLLGTGVEADFERSLELCRLAATNGNANAQLQLADNFYFGEGVERDLEKAVELYELAAQQGNAKAQFNLACMCEIGEGLVEDTGRAIELYKQAAESDHGFAQLALARLLLETKDAENEEYAMRWLHRAAELALPEAMYMLGQLHARGGIRVEKDLEAAMFYYERAVEAEHPGAQVAVAKMILDEGDPERVEEAVQLLLTAEQSGNLEACAHLGNIYLKGLSTDGIRYDLALGHLRRAAEAGYPSAQLSLALMYLNGAGVDEDQPQSAHWMEQAALQGLPEAQYLIGLMYSEGAGKTKDETAALTWFQEAAHNGHPEACYMLARAYSMGIGLDPDEASAIEWCRKAAEQGHADARDLLHQLGAST